MEPLLQTILAKLNTLEESVARIERHLLGPPRQDLGRAAASRERERFLRGQQPQRPPRPPPTIVFHDIYPVEYVFDTLLVEQERPRNGLSAEWMNQLYTCTLGALEEDICEEKTGQSKAQLCQTNCSICLEDGFEDQNREICILPCKHVFHKDCIQDWLQRRPTCPTCRFAFTEIPADT